MSHNSISAAKDFSLTEEEYNEFLKYLSDKTYDYTTKSEKSLEDLKKNSESEKYFEGMKTEYDNLKTKITANKKEDLTKYKAEIKDILEEEIASRYYYQRGRLESSIRDDDELKEAIRVLNNKTLYDSILAGKGAYKVIGKPGEIQAKANTSTDEEGEDGALLDSNDHKMDSLKIISPNKKKGR